MKLSRKSAAKIGLPLALSLLFSLALAQDRGAGLDHGGIIGGSMPDVFKFFNQHTKSK